tara:strand:- start:281 stop:1027 length:747 start_codon:yes stop_codon:yes gene_type:complete
VGSATIALGLGLGGGKSSTASGRPGGGGSFANDYSLDLDGTNDRCSTSVGSTSGSNGAISISDEFSISVWFQCTSSAGWDLIGSGTGGNAWYFGLVKSGSTAYYKQAGGLSAFNSSSVISYNAWHHLLITRDSSDDIKVFLNGNSTPIASGNDNSPMNLDYIGVYYNGSYDPFKGQIDEFAIWDSDKTSSLSDIYNSGAAGDLTSLSPNHWWRFEEGSGTTCADSGFATHLNPLNLDNGAGHSSSVPS